MDMGKKEEQEEEDWKEGEGEERRGEGVAQ